MIPDPLAALPMPAIPPNLPNYGSKSIGGSTTTTLQPGLYSQISVSGAARVTLAAGTYVIQGGGFTAAGSAVITIGAGTSIILEGGGLSVSGAAAVSGTNVTIFNFGTNYNGTTDGGSFGPITLSGSGSVSVTPPSTGVYANILVFQGRDNATALTFSGAATQGITGMIYAPDAPLVESGSAQVGSTSHPISMVVDTLSLSGAAIADVIIRTAPTSSATDSPAQIPAESAAGEASVNGSSPTETGQTLYGLPQSDGNVISGGSNGDNTDAGYILMAGLGTPIANPLVPNLVVNQGKSPTSLGSPVGLSQDVTLTGDSTDIGEPMNVFDALTITTDRQQAARGQTQRSGKICEIDRSQRAASSCGPSPCSTNWSPIWYQLATTIYMTAVI